MRKKPLSKRGEERKAEREEHRRIMKDTEDNFINRHEKVRAVTAAGVMKRMMQMTEKALDFKDELMDDDDAPLFLKLKNADDILDRTISKPTQTHQVQAAVLQANMSNRELKDILIEKLTRKGMVG